MNLPATLSYQQALMPIDPGAVAAAESVKARIQSAYVMALQKPRSEEQSRSRILEACRRPEFAQRVEYSKPVGGTKIVGPSIRFAELAVREWGNVLTETQVVYEDDHIRRVKVTILDLETNATFGKEIQIKKTVERKSSKGREVVGERTNTYGEQVFIVLATDDELHNKEAALISKVIRNEGLRLIPSDIVDEAIDTARKTLHDRDAKDPKAAKKSVLDAFDSIGIRPKEIERYLGHSLDTASPAEMQDLRAVYRAIRDGEASWSDYGAPKDSGSDLNARVMGDDDPGQDDKPKSNRPTKEEMEARRTEAREAWEATGRPIKEAEELVNSFAAQWNTALCERVKAKAQEMAQARQEQPSEENAPETVTCPDTGSTVRVAVECAACDHKAGCPEHE